MTGDSYVIETTIPRQREATFQRFMLKQDCTGIALKVGTHDEECGRCLRNNRLCSLHDKMIGENRKQIEVVMQAFRNRLWVCLTRMEEETFVVECRFGENDSQTYNITFLDGGNILASGYCGDQICSDCGGGDTPSGLCRRHDILLLNDMEFVKQAIGGGSTSRKRPTCERDTREDQVGNLVDIINDLRLSKQKQDKDIQTCKHALKELLEKCTSSHHENEMLRQRIENMESPSHLEEVLKEVEHRLHQIQRQAPPPLSEHEKAYINKNVEEAISGKMTPEELLSRLSLAVDVP